MFFINSFAALLNIGRRIYSNCKLALDHHKIYRFGFYCECDGQQSMASNIVVIITMSQRYTLVRLLIASYNSSTRLGYHPFRDENSFFLWWSVKPKTEDDEYGSIMFAGASVAIVNKKLPIKFHRATPRNDKQTHVIEYVRQ